MQELQVIEKPTDAKTVDPAGRDHVGLDADRLEQAIEMAMEYFGRKKLGPRGLASMVMMIYTSAVADLEELRPALRVIQGGK